MPEFTVRGPLEGQGAACEALLRALPGWFGIEASTVQYAQDADRLPAFLAEETGSGVEGGTRVVGLLAIATHSAAAAEIHVMGVLAERQRRGVGHALLATAEDWLRTQGVRFLTVKTLSAAHPDPGYAATRAFYTAMGFVPLLELPDLWDQGNPCLIMLKTL